MPIHPDELRTIDDQISAGEERISEQKDSVARLKQEGLDATAAREMLLSCKTLRACLSAGATFFCGKVSCQST